MGRLILFLSVVFTSLLTVSNAHSQNERLLAPFSQVISNLDEGEVDSWQLPALAGSLLSFKLEARTGDLDPKLRLYDEAGALILEGDEVSQPGAREVLIEAFTIPYSAVYLIEVFAGGTSGAYKLEVLPGFADWKSTNITDPDFWIDPAREQLIFSPERLSLITSIEVPSVHAQSRRQSEEARLYLHADIDAIDSSESWLVGLTVGVENSTYYSFSVNQDGFWRFALHQGDQMETLSGWKAHPIITAGERDFSLGILSNRGVYELFYNGQYLDGIDDDLLLGSSVVGLLAGYGSAFPVSSRVHFSRLAITSPVNQENDYSRFRFVPNSNTIDLRSLRRAGLIPNEGEPTMLIPEANWQALVAGVSRFPMIEQEKYEDFVLATTVHWETDLSAEAGCGLIFGYESGEDNLLAFVDNGGYGLSQRVGEQYINHSFAIRNVNDRERQHLLILSRASEAIYYLNGRFAGSISDATSTGLVAFAVLNYEDGPTQCWYNDTWLWVWD